MILRPKAPAPRAASCPAPPRLRRSWCRAGCAGPFPTRKALLQKVLRTSRSPPAPPSAVSMRWLRRQERWAGAWRQRLALAAAAQAAREAARVEDKSILRDAVLLTRPSDFLPPRPTNPGPAGLLLLAWRRLAAEPAELAELLDDFGLAQDDAGERSGRFASTTGQHRRRGRDADRQLDAATSTFHPARIPTRRLSHRILPSHS